VIGRNLSHFRILSKIGEGGMGVVYRAEDENLKRPVALKVLPPERVGDEERRMRFLREARAAAAATHPNIATVYEVGEAPADSGGGPGIVFIAMELVEGNTLREAIGGRAMPVKEALRVATEMAEGMTAAHHAGIVHRDLKPENVILRADRHAKILDFGLAKLLDERRMGGEEGAPGGIRGAGGQDADLSQLETISGEMTREGRVFGTAGYMSPEQARGQKVDARSDIFSFGSVLYEMVTGKSPFHGRTAMDTLVAILQKEPATPRALNAGLPGDLERVVLKCLRKEPGERYQHSDELAVDLREVRRTTESGVQATAEAVPARARLHFKRLAWPAGVVLAAGVTIMALLAAFDVGGVRARLWPGAGAGGPIDSLVVLPLRNLSGDPTQEFFADGMTDELTATLARIQSLKVISSTSAMYYKGKNKPLREIAAELRVDAVVEGSVMRSGERVRVTAQLVEGTTDRHLWASSYERDLRDVLALQADVARAIAEEVRTALTPGEKARLSAARPVNPEAYEHYLSGRHFMSKQTAEGLVRAVEEFERAISIDSGYALAHAGLAQAYIEYPAWSVAPRTAALPKAEAASARALELDPDLSEAHLSVALIKYGFAADWGGAEEEFRRAIDLDPGNSTVRARYANFLSWMLRHEEAMEQIRLAQSLDPLSVDVLRYGARGLHRFRRYDEAIRGYRRLLDIHPDFGPARDEIAYILVDQGRYDEAIAALRERLRSRDAEIPCVMAHLARALGLSGREPEARKVIGDLEALSKKRYVPTSYLAQARIGLEDKEPFFTWLERMVADERDSLATLTAPWWDPVRRDPRFVEILRRLKLPER
jgi:TolB-like protein/Tfp pilus assembly protein PilF/predicted Ser/Thr protein kinase